MDCYNVLNNDMRRYLSFYLEPIQAYDICKDIRCNWQKLMDSHYDFVTQGFAIGNTEKEKYKYLADRVSKNVGVDYPDIMFLHDDGKRLKTGDFIYTNIFSKIQNGKGKLFNDKYNCWINSEALDFLFSKYGMILEDTYDNHLHRNNMLKGKLSYSNQKINKNKIITNISASLLEGVLDVEYDVDVEKDVVISEFSKYVKYENYIDKMYNYSIYDLMTDFYINKNEAEALFKIILDNYYEILDKNFDIIEAINQL